MGADCCGGGPPACQEVTKDFGVPSEKLAPHDENKQWEDIVKEKKTYYDHRVQAFEAIKAKYDESLEKAKAANEPLSIEMPDGSVREGVKGVTTPMDIALGISKGLAKKSVVARVDGGSIFKPDLGMIWNEVLATWCNRGRVVGSGRVVPTSVVEDTR